MTCDCDRASHREASLGHVKLRKMVAEEFESNASFGECESLRDQPLKFDRADFRSNPFRLRTPLRFVVVELAVNALR